MSEENTCIIDGVEWQLYAVEFEAEDTTYSSSIWAKSYEHAEVMLQGFKDSGAVVGMRG